MGDISTGLILQEKWTSTACLEGSGLNDIFQWCIHQATIPKSLRIFIELSFGPRTKGKRELLSARIFTLHSRLAGISLIKIRYDRGPKNDPWGTPPSTFHHSDAWPFKTTLWILSEKRILNRHGKESEITEDRSLKIRASCQTLQKALEMYKKFSWVYKEGLASKPLNISWVVENSWDMQESPLWKPDWPLENKSLPSM